MIAIIDYGMGNLRSVQKAIEAVGSSAEVTSDPDRVRRASKVVLPGVGAFADAMAELRRTGLGRRLLRGRAGGQALPGGLPGPSAPVRPEPGGRRTCRARAAPRPDRPLRTAAGPEGPSHGLEHPPHPPARSAAGGSERLALGLLRPLVLCPARRPQVVAAEADYPGPFAAVVWRDNLTACQFHPEKSQDVGLAMYANFVAF